VVTLHTPRLRGTLFSKQVRRACPVGIPFIAELQIRNCKLGSARGQGCTGARRILSALPLLLGYGGGWNFYMLLLRSLGPDGWAVTIDMALLAELGPGRESLISKDCFKSGNGRRGETCTPKAA
jgi:hypothetical protein